MNLQRRIRRALRKWAYEHDSIIARGRRRRMLDMLRLTNIPRHGRILDLGGTEYMWMLFPHNHHVTLLNLPGTFRSTEENSRFQYVEGNACDLREQFDDGVFDLVFSNSVIEHVGPKPQQAQFAAEVRRLGRAYWVQTPSIRFPIEAHSFSPFYWQRRRLMGKPLLWQAKTRVLSRQRMKELLPDAQLYVERFWGLEKSYSFYVSFEERYQVPPRRNAGTTVGARDAQ